MKIKQILKLVSFLLFIGLWIALMATTKSKQNEMSCRDVVISIDHHTGLFFLESDEVKEMMVAANGGILTGTRARKLPLSMIENRLLQNPFVESVEVFMTPTGVLHANIEQRKPLLRVINKYNVSYYLDIKGESMPVSPNFTARVPVVTGYIAEERADHQRDSILQGELYALGRFISSAPFWNAFVQQIYVNEQREFEIVPRIGHQIVMIGTAENMEKKFRKLYIFYREGLRTGSWEKYRTINVKYKNQIVCSKI